MKAREDVFRAPRVKYAGKSMGFDAFELNCKGGRRLLCLAGWDEDGWEHVSASPKGSKAERDQGCPTWDEMRQVKAAFWKPDEMAVEIHPTEESYLHGPTFDTNILHLWRPCDGDWSKLGGKEVER